MSIALYERLMSDLAPLRHRVTSHPVYGELDDVRCLRLFMNNHVFAVWDFMSLLKTLQQRLTCVDVPWLPRRDTAAARMVNEIVLAEETDEIEPGCFASHFEMYLGAMVEVGADTGPILAYVKLLGEGASVLQALERTNVPWPGHRFVVDTLRTCNLETHEVAAAFLLSREDLVPAMFRPMLDTLALAGINCTAYRRYLERHVHLDEETHGPLARRLLESLCGDDVARWQTTWAVAKAALESRRRLWDGVHSLMLAASAC